MNKIPFPKALAWLIVPCFLIMTFPSLAEVGAPSKGKNHVQKLSTQDHPGKGRAACFLQQLNLNKEQQQKVEKTIAEGHKQSQALKKKLRAKRRALMQYLQTPEANQAQALGMNKEINVLQSQIGELRLKTFFSMRAQLNPEQIQKLQHLQKSRQSMGGGHYCPESEDKPMANPTVKSRRD